MGRGGAWSGAIWSNTSRALMLSASSPTQEADRGFPL
ncbi:hypothetical protein ABIC89_000845 [Variovorax boronicumulans]